MADLNIAVAIVGRDAASGPVNNVVRALNGLTQAAQAPTSALGRIGSGIGGVLTRAAGITLAIEAFHGLNLAIGAVEQATIGFNGQMEQAQIAFTGMLGSAANGRAFLADLERFAAVTPFDTSGVIQATRLLLGMGFAAKDVKGILTDLGNVAAGLGLDSSGIEHLALVIGQMHTTGRVMQQDLNQLSQNGVNVGQVFEIMAGQTGKSVAQLKELQQQGHLDADLFITAFRSWSQTRFGDAMAGQSRTFLGALSAIKDSLTIVASTAFRPLFDRLSELAQRFATFVSSDQFSAWGAHIAAVVDIVLDALGSLANGFFSALSGVLSVTLDIGHAIYDALSWLNPFATHSPSLVSQVHDGVDAIIAKYETLGLIADPVKAAGQALQQLGADTSAAGIDRLKSSVDALKDRATLLKDALSAAKSQLSALSQTPIQGEGAFQDRIARLQDQINQQQLALLDAQMGGARQGARQAQSQLQRLQLLLQQAQLQEKVRFDPEHRAIAAAANPRQELPFNQIIAGIQSAQKDITTLQPAVDKATDAWNAQAAALQSVQAAAAAAKTALAGTGNAIKTAIGDMSFLDDAKKQLAEWDTQFAAYRAKVEQDAKPFLDAAQKIAAGFDTIGNALRRVKTEGIAGGLTELLFPSEQLPPRALERATTATGQPLSEPIAPTVQHPVLDVGGIAREVASRLGDAFSTAIRNVDWTRLGHDVSTGMTSAIAGIDWNAVVSDARTGDSLFAALNQDVRKQSYVPIGKSIADELVDATAQTLARETSLSFQAKRVQLAVDVVEIVGAPIVDLGLSIGKVGADIVAGFLVEFFHRVSQANVTKEIAAAVDEGIVQPMRTLLTGQGPGKISFVGQQMTDDLYKATTDGTRKHAQEFAGIGSDVVKGIQGGVDGQRQSLIDTMRNTAQGGIVDPFKDVLKSHSPSRVFAAIGDDIVQGLIDGIDNRLDALRDTALAMGQVIRDSLAAGLGKTAITVALATASSATTTSTTIPSGPTFAATYSPHRRGFANGGSFLVGGSGGTDSQLVQFAATPRERVTVSPPGQQPGVSLGALFGGPITIRSAADVDALLARAKTEMMDLLINGEKTTDIGARKTLAGAVLAR